MVYNGTVGCTNTAHRCKCIYVCVRLFVYLCMEEKNKVSHRGKVLMELSAEFDKVMKWLEQRVLEEMPEQPDHAEFEDNDWSR